MRLFFIALVSLYSFFIWFWALSWLLGNDNSGALGAVVLSFVVTPMLLLRFWPGKTPGARCPGGKGLYPECLYVITVKQDAIHVVDPRNTRSSVARADIREIAIETNDSGPWRADVWWIVKTADGGLRFPQGATGEEAALRWFQAFPGYRDEVVIQAMGSTSNEMFVCWAAER